MSAAGVLLFAALFAVWLLWLVSGVEDRLDDADTWHRIRDALARSVAHGDDDREGER